MCMFLQLCYCLVCAESNAASLPVFQTGFFNYFYVFPCAFQDSQDFS